VDRCGDQRYRNLIGSAGWKKLSLEQKIQGRKSGEARPKITSQCCITISPYSTPFINLPFDIYGKIKKDIKREYYQINSVIFLVMRFDFSLTTNVQYKVDLLVL
jgi:hypothetical protein